MMGVAAGLGGVLGVLFLVLLVWEASRMPPAPSAPRRKGWIRDDRPAPIEYESVVDFGGGFSRWRSAEP